MAFEIRRFCILLAVFLVSSDVYAHVVCRFRGRLGNQLFQAAAAIALAEENQCGIYFPDFDELELFTEDYGLKQLKDNYRYIFNRLPCLREKVIPSYTYQEPDFDYHPIPYQGDTEIVGYFVSEKFFRKYKNKIIDCFSPSSDIEEKLLEKYEAIIHHPQTVGIHIRTGYLEYTLNHCDESFYKNFLAPDVEFFQKALELFDEKALIVVFSDHIGWCKKNLSSLNREMIFIENQDYIHDFYLLSKCKHAIIANSTFAWWAAYLNKNPEKKVICRKPFFAFDLDICCPEWIELPIKTLPSTPQFNGDL